MPESDPFEALNRRVGLAVQRFWETRRKQAVRHAEASDDNGIQGSRTAVTGGAQLDGFATLLADLLEQSGIPEEAIHHRTASELPGYYRPTKKWDLVVNLRGSMLAAAEFKSQVGSFGNNFNNRVEEAIGSATDFKAAYRERAFRRSSMPWLGYLMLLEDSPKTRTAVVVSEPHYSAFPEFKGASYADRYDIFCQRLVSEGLYDSACLLLSDSDGGLRGRYSEPDLGLSFERFARSMILGVMARHV